MSAFFRPPAIVTAYIRATNNSDLEALIGTFAQDAIVNSCSKIHQGPEEIRQWAIEQVIGKHVTFEVEDIRDQYGITVISAIADGNFDKTACPEPNYLEFYFMVRAEKIVLMILIRDSLKSGKV